MSRGWVRRTLVLIGATVALLSATAANAALVEVNSLILRADGSYQPETLLKHRFTPIEFQGHFEIAAKDGGQPVALQQAVIDFDRDGRLSVGGLPACDPNQVANASTADARRACPDSIVGTGRIDAAIRLLGGVVPGSSPLTIFNGPLTAEGHPTAILHARTSVPLTETYAIVAPIEQRRGPFRYRVTLDIPPIAGGLGSLTRIRAKVGRRFDAGGAHRSYVSARCSDSILQTHGRFTFADGTVIDGSVEKFCRVR
jgi:hypothetical protein